MPLLATHEVLNQTPRVRVMRRVRQWISEGSLPAGERIPTVGELVDRLGVSRGTVHGALRDLEVEGVIRARGRARFAVGSSGEAGERVLADTVAILSTVKTPPDGSPDGSPEEVGYSGWEHVIQNSAARILADQYHVLVLNPGRLDGDRIQALAKSGLHGALLSHYMLKRESGQRVADALTASNIPVAIYGAADEFSTHDTVYSDHEAGAYEVTRWLIGKGCRRILRVWHQFSPADYPAWLAQRDSGYLRAVSEAGIGPLPALEVPIIPRKEGQPHEDYFQLGVRMLAGFLIESLQSAQPADALMVISDGVVPSVIAACNLLGRTRGKDLLISGYDNYWQTSPEYVMEKEGPAVTVDKCNARIGLELAKLLQQRMAGQLPAEPQHRIVKPELVVVSA